MTAERHPDIAQQIAYGIDEHYSRALALSAVAKVLAKRDPDLPITLVCDAEKAIRQLPTAWRRVEGLTGVARILLDVYPDRSRRLLAEAEEIERLLGNHYDDGNGGRRIDPDGEDKDHRLIGIAETMGTLDPAEAKRIAGGVGVLHFDGLTRVAVAAASRDPGLAESIAVSAVVDSGYWATKRIDALIHIARALIDYAPERAAALLAKAENLIELAKAEKLAEINQSYYTEEYKAERLLRLNPDLNRHYLLNIGKALARIDPAEAVRIADGLSDDPYCRAELLCSAARRFGAQDPTRAASLLADAECDARRIPFSEDEAAVLVKIVITQMALFPPA